MMQNFMAIFSYLKMVDISLHLNQVQITYLIKMVNSFSKSTNEIAIAMIFYYSQKLSFEEQRWQMITQGLIL